MKQCTCLRINDDAATVCSGCGKSDWLDVAPAGEVPAAAAGPAAEEAQPDAADALDSDAFEEEEQEAAPKPAPKLGQAPGTGHYENFLELIRRYTAGAKKPRILVFLGHSNSGKSWYI